MKKVIGYTVVALAAFAAGGITGWFARKKTSEVAFDVVDISPVETDGDRDGDDKGPVVAGKDLEKIINDSFTLSDTEKAYVKADLVDTQKEQYFKRWKAEEAVSKYDTRTKEAPEDPVVTEENLEEGFDQDFLDEAGEETTDIPVAVNRPPIEEASMEDWNHWLGTPDGEYDCEVIYWFEKDKVITWEDGEPIDNPLKKTGFDVIGKFGEIDEDTTGDPDIRVVYNNRQKTIYQIIRRPGSYNRKRGMEELGSDYIDEDDDTDE